MAHAAGRTDAGVHAIGLGVSFPAPANWTASALRRALNALLPRDCWVGRSHAMRARLPRAQERARPAATATTSDSTHASASPFRRPFEWALGRPLDRRRSGAAATLLHGEHDFPRLRRQGRAQAALPLPPGASPSGRSGPDGRGVSFHVEADRFLHHMVRMLVGTMVDIGLGRRPLSDIELLLERGDNQATSPPAPPQGLYFVAAAYPAGVRSPTPDDDVRRGRDP